MLNISRSRQRECSSRVYVCDPKLPHISQRSFNTNSTFLDSNGSQQWCQIIWLNKVNQPIFLLLASEISFPQSGSNVQCNFLSFPTDNSCLFPCRPDSSLLTARGQWDQSPGRLSTSSISRPLPSQLGHIEQKSFFPPKKKCRQGKAKVRLFTFKFQKQDYTNCHCPNHYEPKCIGGKNTKTPFKTRTFKMQKLFCSTKKLWKLEPVV